MQWFRFYNDAINDPKVQCLPDAAFKFWVNILCLASKNNGYIPDNETVSFALRVPLHDVTTLFLEIAAAGLLDGQNETRSPHNWKKRQFRSDTSNERVKRHRKRSKTVTRNVTVTPPETDTEQSITEQNNTPIPPKRGIVKPEDVSEEVWNDFKSHRKAKRSAVTQTAIDGIRRESDKAGITLTAAMQEMMSRGWQGFKAEWIEAKAEDPTMKKNRYFDLKKRYAKPYHDWMSGEEIAEFKRLEKA